MIIDDIFHANILVLQANITAKIIANAACLRLNKSCRSCLEVRNVNRTWDRAPQTHSNLDFVQAGTHSIISDV